MERAIVIRYGGFGDAIQASSILPGLAAQGYAITVDVSEAGELMLRHDPHVSGILVTPAGSVSADRLGEYWNARTNGFHRTINLCESVECAFLQRPNMMGFYRDDAARRRLYSEGNYVEHIHRIAGVEPPYRPWYYTTPEEDQVAADAIGNTLGVMLVLAGSTEYKIWRDAIPFVGRILETTGAKVFLAGGEKDSGLADAIMREAMRNKLQERLVDLTGLGIRETMAIACQCSVIVGPETGIPNAMAMRPMRKIVMLSHSTGANLTRDWINTDTLAPDVACHPCHRLHANSKFCPRGPSGQFPACTEAISPDVVYSLANEALESGIREGLSAAAD